MLFVKIEVNPLPDTNFRLNSRFPTTVILRAQRRAVLFPLTNARRLQTCYESLIHARRSRIEELVRAGWRITSRDDLPRERKRLKVQYIRNCPPFGVPMSSIMQPCLQVRFCPFCFARRNIAGAIASIHHAVRHHRNLNYRLTAIHVRPLIEASAPSPEEAIKDVETQRKHMKAWAHEADGMITAIGVVPGDDHRFQLRISMLSLTRDARCKRLLGIRDKRPESWKDRSIGFSLTDPNPTLTTICDRVAATMTYPRELMFGDARDVATLLNALNAEKLHTRISTGVLRNRTSQKNDEDARIEQLAPKESQDTDEDPDSR